MARKSTTVPANEVTDVIVSSETVASLSAAYISLQNSLDLLEAPNKWEWAKSVTEWLDYVSSVNKKDRTVKSEELGAIIGTELRGKPYSGPWVRLHCSAYNKFKKGFTLNADGSVNKDECREFQAVISGNAGKGDRKPKEPKEPATNEAGEELDSDGEVASDFLAKVRYSIKRALTAGIAVSDIQATCALAIKELAP